MLKNLYLNHRKLPVPIPIKNLNEAIVWVEKNLVRDGFSLTKITLDSQDLDFLDDESQLQQVSLNSSSKLEVQVDSVQDMSIQTIDVMRTLASIMEKGLKQLAVSCWQSEEDSKKVVNLKATYEDLELLVDMMSHVEVLVQSRVSVTNISLIRRSILKYLDDMKSLDESRQGKTLAKLMLKQLEPTLRELGYELSMLQNSVFEAYADKKEAAIQVG